MSNLYKRLLEIMPSEPIDKGVVVEIHSDGVTVELMSGALVRVRGEAVMGAHVFVRGGRIEGPAPELSGTDQFV